MSRSPLALRSRLLVPLALVALAGAGTAAAQCSGAPTFTAPVAYASGPGLPVSGIAHADFDGDGDFDLVACAGPQIIVFVNQGTGTFSVQPPIAAPFNLVDVVTGDFDADGRPDIAAVGTAVAASPAGLVLQAQGVTYLNHSTPIGIGFAGPTTLPVGLQAVTGSIGRALRAADLNADGILDLVVVDGNSASVWVALGQGAFGLGDGTFGAPTPYPINGTLHQDVAIGDFNHDGAPDLAVVRYGGCNCPTPVTLLAGVLDAAGVPTGTFAPAGSITIPGPSECENIETADLDDDGFLDLAISSYVSVEVAWGTGGFGFTPATYALGAYPLQIAVGDFSADGRPDLATARGVPASSAPTNLSVLVGQVGVGFVGYDYALDASLPHCIDAADFDGDGRLDLAAGHANGVVDVCLGTCTPAVPPAVSIVWPNGGEIVSAGISTSIVWSKTASIALVDLDESYDGGVTWRRIASDVSGTSTAWLPAPPGTGNAFVRVRAAGTPAIADASNYPFTILGPGAATSTSVGPGCGPGLAPPSLTIGLPRLGLTVLISVQGGTPSSPGGVAVSPGQAAPIVFTPGCTVYIDPLSALLLDAIATDGLGDWSNSYPIPHLTFLAGSTVRAQAALLLPAGAFELTNGVELTLGF